MRSPPLVPVDRREYFYALLDGDFQPYNFKHNPELDWDARVSNLSTSQEVYWRFSLAALDLGLGATATKKWLAELAYAAKLYVEAGDRQFPLHAFNALFAFQAVIDAKSTQAFARALLGRAWSRRGREASSEQVELLVNSLCHSILGEQKQVSASLANVEKLGPIKSSRKAGPRWVRALVDVARACLLGPTRDLPQQLSELAAQASAYMAKDFEEVFYEPCFSLCGLAFLARARDRGVKLEGIVTPASMPTELLGLPRGALPKHPWHTWPLPDQRLKRAAAEAFRVANAPTAAKRRHSVR